MTNPRLLIADIETNGLLDTLDTIHCISLQECDEEGKPLGPVLSSNDHGTGELTIAEAVKRLTEADTVVGHNWLGFDEQALAKVFPGFKTKRVLDTMLIATLVFPDLKDRDFKFRKKNPDFPGQLIGRHSLEAWGYRLGEWKGDYAKEMEAKGLDPWAEWNQEMDDYCDQDVRATRALFERLMLREPSPESIELEHAIAPILRRQGAYGFLFDQKLADRLERELLTKRQELADKLAQVFPPWERKAGPPFIPKRDNKRLGYKAGVPVQKYETVTFNPGSRYHIADRLQELRGWKPHQFTPKGQPKVDEDVLESLPVKRFPEAPLLLDYFKANKVFGQLASPPPKILKDGSVSKAKRKSEAWRDHVGPDGRIHGRVNQNGAVTGRMTHSSPNIAQVPSVHKGKDGKPLKGLEGGWGYECRSLFKVPKGKKLVGADASGLELRCLAHFMAQWDGGEYAKVLLEGDIHTENQKAAGLPTRDMAKTFIYGFLYGAGDAKIGSIVGKGRKAGAELRAKFLRGLPALATLSDRVKKKARKQGWIRGLDGRKLHIRSDHAALNTLLQSAGALVMKQGLVILDRKLQDAGLVPGENYEFVANVHDEWQLEVDEEHAEFVGKSAVEAIREAGEHFKFRCLLDGEYQIGDTWAETH